MVLSGACAGASIHKQKTKERNKKLNGVSVVNSKAITEGQ